MISEIAVDAQRQQGPVWTLQSSPEDGSFILGSSPVQGMVPAGLPARNTTC